MIRLLFVALLTTNLFAQQPGQWITPAEQSGFRTTPRYDETIAWCRRVAKVSPWVRVEKFGVSPQGRDLPFVLVSKHNHFTPSAVRKAGKAVVMIQSAIHAGEMDGKDATLMLLRELAITKKYERLLDRIVVLFIPIFNVDGHERFGPYNRINQNGPEQMGWRVTAQTLNLNRDYMKADAPEMRAWLALFQRWNPDFFVDCHVTDGIDFQYDVTYAMETWPNADRELSQWYEKTFQPRMVADVEADGHGIVPYVVPREDNDLSRGLVFSASNPRLSTGYCAKQNRPALLIETHMLKPYKTRVMSTYSMLVSTLRFVNDRADELKNLLASIDRRYASMGSAKDQTYLPLRYTLTDSARPVFFRGVVSHSAQSDISGDERIIYTSQPRDTTIPYYSTFRVTDSVTVPPAYFLPKEWSALVPILTLHGIEVGTVAKEFTTEVEYYRLNNPKWQERPFEFHHMLSVTPEEGRERRVIPRGTFVIPTTQRSVAVIMGLLEPKAPDAFLAWGFFDGIFEQKEYGEPYVLEKLARSMLEENPDLRKEFEATLASDTAFARSPYQRLNFFYKKSPFWDHTIGLYPVCRATTPVDPRLVKKME